MKFLILMALLLVLVPIISAEVQTLPPVKAGQCINLIQLCSNCTYNMISSIMLPNYSLSNLNSQMTKVNTQYNFNFCNTTQFGQYVVNGFGDLNGVNTSWSYDFPSTPNGELVQSSGFLIFVYIIFGALVFVLLFTFVINIAKIATTSTSVYDIAWSWGIYFLILFTWWLSNDYITASFIRSNMDTFLAITGFTHIILPLTSFVITMIVRSGMKGQNLSVQEIIGRRMEYG